MHIDRFGKRVNPAGVVQHDGQVFNGDVLQHPRVVTALGIVEIPDPIPPVDFTHETHSAIELDVPPYVRFERKPQEVIDHQHNAAIVSAIHGLEVAQARAIREAILSKDVSRLADIDRQITELRSQLKPIQQ